MTLKWHGKRVTAKLVVAQIVGVNATMSEAVIHAKKNHPWRNRTGILERSIGVAQFAKKVATGARGVWGSQDVRYALIQELGGLAGRGRRVIIPERPYLRPAAAETYPGLSANIMAAML
ncbi:hypothetical protein LCGC14_1405370 [marine sediment metagenome]|uniref:Uncharacterized protein n=1 Tax=marine sediment metagenome TaxID=412755 RepID=A0A0F9MXE9_9ZZZZ